MPELRHIHGPTICYPRRRAAVSLIAALCLGFTTPVAFAQVRLTAELTSKSDFTAAESAQIATFVTERLTQLSDADADVVKNARAALFEPLDTGVSVGFRLEYAKVLDQRLASLIEGKDARLAAIALRLAGRIATATSERQLQKGMASREPATRFAAAVGYQELLRTVGEGALGLGDAAVEKVLTSLRDAISTEKDPRVVDAIILALDGIPNGGAGAPLRVRAMLRASEGGLALTRRLRKESPASDNRLWATALLRDLDIVYQTLLTQMQAGAGAVSPEFAKAAASFGGASLAFVRDRIAAAAPADETPSLRMIVGAAENIIVLADQVINPAGKATSRKLPDSFDQAIERGNANWFTEAAAPYIGANGTLTKPPYSMKPEELAPARK
ncbi:MAG TPA: hypothetical protein VG797_05990 [Phycisphaerales bacterium]|nr:hypothetical protein [Phycisphaerales bacterium]